MNQARRPKAFISYSSQDSEIAAEIASRLEGSGVRVWFADWEIQAGDSLIQKIFTEGLANADIFLVLISRTSAVSRWVREELDAALIRRIEGVTRIIPVKLDDTEIPHPLRALKWVSVYDDMDGAVRDIVQAASGIRQRPAVATGLVDAPREVRGLTPLAARLALFIADVGDGGLERERQHKLGSERWHKTSDLARELSLEPRDIDDAIDELESFGLAKALSYMGTHPYRHASVEPTYALFLRLGSAVLPYDPEADIKSVASAIAASDTETPAEDVADRTGLSPLRVNRATAYLADYGIASVIRTLGTAPFDFYTVAPTFETRRYVEQVCR